MGKHQPGTTRNLDPLTELELDPLNPRLRRDDKGASPEQILALMITDFEVLEIAESIVASGYLPFDPLLGYDSPEHEGIVRVREGNRRVAATKLLLHPLSAPKQHQPTWISLADRMTTDVRKSIEKLEIEVWPDASGKEMNSYIGFRHVNGIRPWPAAEKANFIGHLIEDENLSYKEVAELLGSKPKHVERHYVAFKLSDLAHTRDTPGAHEMEQNFGVLIRALQAKGIGEFIGVGYTGEPRSPKLPESDDELENLVDFVAWTFGTKNVARLLPDSRQITRLATIIRSPEALAYLRRTPDPKFEHAWQRAGGEAAKLVETLFSAADLLREATPIVGSHLNDPDVLQALSECRRFWGQIETLTSSSTPQGAGTQVD